MRSASSRTSAPASAVPQGCSSLKLRQLSRRVSQQFDAIVGKAGLKTTQYSLLSHIVRLGPLRPGQLAAAMDMDASTLTRNLQPLVLQGWVEVGPGGNSRSRQVAITEAGLAKQAATRKEWKRAQQAFNARLGNDLVLRLHAVIDECLAVVHDGPPTPG